MHPTIAALSCRSATVAEQTRRRPPAAAVKPPPGTSSRSKPLYRFAPTSSSFSPSFPSPPVSIVAEIELPCAPLFQIATRDLGQQLTQVQGVFCKAIDSYE